MLGSQIKFPRCKWSFARRDTRHLYKYFRKCGIKISISQVGFLYHNWSEIGYNAGWLCHLNKRTMLKFYKSLNGDFSYKNAYETIYKGRELSEPNFWEKYDGWNDIKDQSILEE